ncbi:MAG: hypothetical protein WKG06_42880 [Segetibacter sp.]
MSGTWQKLTGLKKLFLIAASAVILLQAFVQRPKKIIMIPLSIIEYSKYDMSYMFFYSERPGTLAARRFADDVPTGSEKRRLDEIVKLQNRMSYQSNLTDIGKTFKVLIEGKL